MVRRICRRLTVVQTVLTLFGLLVLALFSQLLPGYEPWWLSFFLTLFVCLVILVLMRYGRVVWRDLVRFRCAVTAGSISALPLHRKWSLTSPPGWMAEQARHCLVGYGYRVRLIYRQGGILLSAMRGGANRCGFFLAHGGLVLLCLGLLLDSRLLTQIAPAAGRLDGVVQLQTDVKSDQVQLVAGAGEQFVLPFQLELQQISLVGGLRRMQEQYRTRMLLHDVQRNHTVQLTVGTNQPVSYRGFDFYQQAVSDAGTILHIRVWPLFHARMAALKQTAAVYAERHYQTSRGPILIRFNDFNPKTIVTEQDASTGLRVYRNLGPRLDFNAAMPDGQQLNYIMYMLPFAQQGRYFFLSGVRDETSELFHYLHIPADPEGEITRFLRFHAALNDQVLLNEVVRNTVGRSGESAARESMIQNLLKMIELFNHAGFSAVEQELANYTTPEKLPGLVALTTKLLRNVFYQIYEKVVQEEERATAGAGSSFDIRFFEDALTATAGLGRFGLPLFIQLDDFEYKPAVQLQVKKKPGKYWFFSGALLILLGVSAMLYSRHRRVWLWFDNGYEKGMVLCGGMGGRHKVEFAEEFSVLVQHLESAMQP
ncbi:MAG: cytochrome c biogenesis protein ResB [Gammaproteobacteria bacterium]|nr:cytochrome c biogenesis protein ResB [Gammaproteobacteria bacterium]MDH5650482.1 cytochrome c biogenesis protein ResB [Gammaproteobacteria bacterium]